MPNDIEYLCSIQPTLYVNNILICKYHCTFIHRCVQFISTFQYIFVDFKNRIVILIWAFIDIIELCHNFVNFMYFVLFLLKGSFKYNL